jgi:hypothetical protein
MPAIDQPMQGLTKTHGQAVRQDQGPEQVLFVA